MINYFALPSKFKFTVAARISSTVFLLILVLFVISIIAWVNAGQEANQDAMHEIATDLEDSHRAMTEQTRDLENLSRWVTSRNDIRSLVKLQDKAGLQAGLTPLIGQSMIDSVAVLDSQGSLLSQLSRNPAGTKDATIVDAEWLGEAAKEQGTSTLALQPSGDLEIIYILPIPDVAEGSLLGYLIIGYSLDDHFIKRVTSTDHAQAIILANDQVSASSLVDDAGKPWVGKQLPIGSDRTGNNISFASLNANGQTFLFGVKQIALTSDGSVVRFGIGIPQTEITQSTWVSFQGVGLPLAAASLGLLIASFFWRKRLSQVNEELALATNLLNQGTPVPLNLHLEEAERKEEQKRFWLNVAHELRSPLTSMRTSIDLLLEDYGELKPSEAEAMLQRLQASAFRFQNLVENLLDYGSIQTGRFIMRPKPVELDVIINEAVEQVYPLLQARRQQIMLEFDRKHTMVLADRHRIEEVIVNLLCNASKYSPSDQLIRLSTCRDAGRVFVGVTDQGAGIAAEEQTAIFQPFYRAQQASTDIVGLGLGLALAKENVEQHGGRIGVNSFPGHPTTFWFSLPEHEPDASAVHNEQECDEYENYAGR